MKRPSGFLYFTGFHGFTGLFQIWEPVIAGFACENWNDPGNSKSDKLKIRDFQNRGF